MNRGDRGHNGRWEAQAWIGGRLLFLARFFAQHAPQHSFERFPLALHVIAQRRVDQGLVVAARGLCYPVAEPVDDVGIQADRDPGLAELLTELDGGLRGR